MITGETLIKGLFYFMLKAGRMGGKYRSRKEVIGKDGKKTYIYDYGKKPNSKKKVTQKDVNRFKDSEKIILIDDDAEQKPKKQKGDNAKKILKEKSVKQSKPKADSKSMEIDWKSPKNKKYYASVNNNIEALINDHFQDEGYNYKKPNGSWLNDKHLFENPEVQKENNEILRQGRLNNESSSTTASKILKNMKDYGALNDIIDYTE